MGSVLILRLRQTTLGMAAVVNSSPDFPDPVLYCPAAGGSGWGSGPDFPDPVL
mgnify:FL=1